MSEKHNPPPNPAYTNGADKASEPDWTFRGHRMRPSEFNAAMAHLYRGEIARANTWRSRLDITTNWAVVVTATAISFALSAAPNHHAVIIISTLFVTLFLYIEARRYRYYELWSYRVRLMEQDFFATMLVPPFGPAKEWAENLAESLLHPDFPISMLEALGRRFRRNYFWVYIVLALAWVLKMTIHPTVATSMEALISRAAIGPIPGWGMIIAGLVYNGVLITIGLLTTGMQHATGEVLPKHGVFPFLTTLARAVDRRRKTEKSRPQSQNPLAGQVHRRRGQFLALIITDHAEQIAKQVMRNMKRGTTALHGTGMYTGHEHHVLLVAVTVTEVPHLKALVQDEDSKAFVILTPAQEILGKGFRELSKHQAAET